MKLTPLLALLVLLLAPDARAELQRSYEFTLDGVLPSVEPNTQYFAQYNLGAPAPEASVYSVSGGFLRQRTTGFNGAKEYILGEASGGNIINGGLDASLPVDCEARLRVLNSTGPTAATLDVIDGQHRRSIAVVAGGVLINFATNVNIPGFDMTQFHTVRVTSPGASSGMKAYVDGVLVFNGQGASLPTSNGLQWGDISSTFSTGQGADVDWDYVRLTNAFPAAPALSGAGVALLMTVMVALGLMRLRYPRMRVNQS